MFKRTVFGLSISLLVGSVSASLVAPAAAEEVTFAFSGTIDLILPRGNLPESIQEGDLLTGRFTFDASVPGIFAGPGAQSYISMCRVEAQVEGLLLEGEVDLEGNPSGIVVRDQGVGAFQDGYSVQMFSIGGIDNFTLNLLAPPGTDAIVGTGLPTVPPDPALFAEGSRTILVSLGDEFEQAQLSVGDAENFGTLTVAEEPLPCPEPGAAASALACAAALALVRGTRRPGRPSAAV